MQRWVLVVIVMLSIAGFVGAPIVSADAPPSWSERKFTVEAQHQYHFERVDSESCSFTLGYVTVGATPSAGFTYEWIVKYGVYTTQGEPVNGTVTMNHEPAVTGAPTIRQVYNPGTFEVPEKGYFHLTVIVVNLDLEFVPAPWHLKDHIEYAMDWRCKGTVTGLPDTSDLTPLGCSDGNWYQGITMFTIYTPPEAGYQPLLYLWGDEEEFLLFGAYNRTCFEVWLESNGEPLLQRHSSNPDTQLF